MKKRVLIYAHYFYPDVASTGQILTDLCEGMQEDFKITVICVVPSYTGKINQNYQKKFFFHERYKNVKILRIRVPEFNKQNKTSRIKNILVYFFLAIIATFKVGKQDIVFSISQPPILGGLLGVIGKIIKRASFVYNIQDFNPEQVEAIRYLKNKVLIGLAKVLDNVSCRASDIVVVVGRDMKETLEKRFYGRKSIKNIVVNNWIDEKQVYPLEKNNEKVVEFKNKYGLTEKFVFMYSGNLGLYYDLQNIIKVIAEFKYRNDLIFAFVGDGSMRQSLEEYVAENKVGNVKFIPYQDKKELNYALNAADMHIVSNAKRIKGVSVPSKVYGVMAVGKPIIGVLEPGSEARNIIEEAQCGICTEPDDYNKLYELLDYIIKNKETIKSKGNSGRIYLEKNLRKELSIEKYKQAIYDV